MPTISLKLPDELLARLDKTARERRVTKSSLIRERFEKGLTERRQADSVSCYDLAREFAGAIRGLPEDLADNPKHMEGFGE
jgi:predicted DNA-binding protein